MKEGLGRKRKLEKRFFDFFLSSIGFIVLILPLIILFVLATIWTRKFGLFGQERFVYSGKIFTIFIVRTMKEHEDSSVITI